MTDKQHPEAFCWATELAMVRDPVTLTVKEAREVSDEMQLMHAELETLNLYKSLADEYGLSIFPDIAEMTAELETLRAKLKTYEFSDHPPPPVAQEAQEHSSDWNHSPCRWCGKTEAEHFIGWCSAMTSSGRYRPQPAPQQGVQEHVEIPAKCPYFGPSPHRDVWLEGWYAACATQPAAPQAAGKAVHQFRKQYCADWYDGRTDHGDSGGPYEERTLYTVPQPTAQGDELDVVLDAFENKTRGIPQAHIAAALVAELRAAIDAARTTPTARVDALDAARLDFLIEHRAYVVSDDTCRDGYWLRFPVAGGTTSVQIGEYETPREAIDAARAAQEGKKP